MILCIQFEFSSLNSILMLSCELSRTLIDVAQADSESCSIIYAQIRLSQEKWKKLWIESEFCFFDLHLSFCLVVLPLDSLVTMNLVFSELCKLGL